MADRIVVVAPNWLGDAVMALPAIGDVVRARPAGSVDVAARASVAPLFSMVEGVGVVTLGRERRASLEALRRGGYQAALLLPNSFGVARLARQADIPERWGYVSDLRSWLLTRRVVRIARLHQTEYYRRLVRELGFSVDERPPQITPPPDARAGAAALLASEGWDHSAPLVAMAPGAAFGTAKRWPARSFAALADEFSADGIRTVLIGTENDRSAVMEVAAAMHGAHAPIVLVGRTDVPTLAGVLSHCRAAVCNDSGAMHLAAALGVNVLALVGPTRERETHPTGRGRHIVLTNPVWCRPCMLRECPLTHRCMTGITVDRAAAAARQLW